MPQMTLRGKPPSYRELLFHSVDRRAPASVLKDGADEDRKSSQDHDEDRHGPPPFRQLLGEQYCAHPENDRGSKQVSAPCGHTYSLIAAEIPR